MLDIKFLRENPEIVKQNIKNKFQDSKLPLVDEVIELDKRNRDIKKEVEALRAERNKISKMIGGLMKEGRKEEAEEVKKKVTANAETVERLSAEEREVEEKIRTIMMTIPNIIDPSVPIGKDDTENVEVQKYGEPVVPEFEIPYHAEIMESFNGLDLDSARKVAGNGFYYLMGDIFNYIGLFLNGNFFNTAICCYFLRKGFYDKQRIYLLCTSFHDPQRCGDRRYELC